MLKPCAGESKARNWKGGRSSERRLISDNGQTPSYESHNLDQRTGKIPGVLSKELRALDGWMLARALASQLIRASTTMDLGTTFLFLHDVIFEKRGLLADRTDFRFVADGVSLAWDS